MNRARRRAAQRETLRDAQHQGETQQQYHDRMQRSIDAKKDGDSLTWAETMHLHPFMTVLDLRTFSGMTREAAMERDPDGVVVASGFMEDEVIANVIESVRCGMTIWVFADSRELREEIKRRVILAFNPTDGSA